MAQKIKWEPIREPNLYGEIASVENRTAKVVRASEGEWLFFALLDGKIVCTGHKSPSLTKAEAKRRGVLYLNGTEASELYGPQIWS